MPTPRAITASGRRPGGATCSTPRSQELFETPGAPAGVALAAIGGYGRRQQLPRSDVDLLVLHEGDRLDEVAVLVERLLYPLWDAGFEVGHAVRTTEECVVAARERLDGLTSMLDLRSPGGGPGARRSGGHLGARDRGG